MLGQGHSTLCTLGRKTKTPLLRRYIIYSQANIRDHTVGEGWGVVVIGIGDGLTKAWCHQLAGDKRGHTSQTHKQHNNNNSDEESSEPFS